ncbi:cell division protein FtsL [Paenibacillus aquistagni]|uniref:Cell division protein FtsL n=1 Tax=Paenibacillus aquistagni TaxID=1852522 RepID=A0A1X7IF23_9BACL|nr:cell division protein FtsL [Paenibacillus aquistagni]NMM51466.1 cell division protein FtsL [Paenibacillus aquistagni]SMG13307.1 cell division protein FtsL [Paenibacillus aquistagni]
MAYVRGNLAVRPERRPEEPARYKESKKKVVKKATLSTREKLLYLMTIVVCSLVALLLISRFAEIYTFNRDMEAMKNETAKLESESQVLKVEIEKLSDWNRIEAFAKSKGLVYLDEPAEMSVRKTQIED